MNFIRLVRRLLACSPQELSFRIMRQMHIVNDRLASSLRRDFLAGVCLKVVGKSPPEKTQEYFEYWQSKKNFYFSVENREQIIELFSQKFPEYLPSICEIADRIVEHEIPVFGKNISYPSKIGWQNDPLGQKMWPNVHWSKISVVDDQAALDAKWTWELNRHQFLVPVAIAYWNKKDVKYAEFVVDHLLDWIADNPPGYGINWVESLEVATRVVCWVWLLELLRGSTALTAEKLARILDCLVEHAEHIYKYSSHYISPNTHLTGEALGLYLFSAVYDEYGLSEKWQKVSRKILDSEIARQMGKDGVHRELSTYYHCYTIDYYLQYYILAELKGYRLKECVKSYLENAIFFLLMIERHCGTLPMFGDGDGGKALPLTCCNDYSSNRTALALGSLLFNRADFRARASEITEDCVWLMGPGCYRRFHDLKGKLPKQTAVHFSESNYIVCRTGWEADDHYLIFDAGKMGFLSAGHSHADYLHFELGVFGQPVIIDTGTYSYKKADWRNYCRGTSAHNTVRVDQREQVEVSGSFAWRKIPQPGNGYLFSCAGINLMYSSHACYSGVEHSRSILIFEKDFFVITDKLQSEEQHQYEYYFHFDPEIDVKHHGNSFLMLKADKQICAMNMYGFTEPQVELFRASKEPFLGWTFPRYGNRLASYSLKITEKENKNHKRHFLLLPTGSYEIKNHHISKNGELLLQLTSKLAGKEVFVQEFPGPATTNQELSLDCDVCVSCWRNGSLSKIFVRNVKLLAWKKEVIYESEAPLSYLALEKTEHGWNVFTPKQIEINKTLTFFKGQPIIQRGASS